MCIPCSSTQRSFFLFSRFPRDSLRNAILPSHILSHFDKQLVRSESRCTGCFTERCKFVTTNYLHRQCERKVRRFALLLKTLYFSSSKGKKEYQTNNQGVLWLIRCIDTNYYLSYLLMIFAIVSTRN